MENKLLLVFESRIATVDIVENTIFSIFSGDLLLDSKVVSDVTEADLFENDVFIFIRTTDYLSRKLAIYAKKIGKLVIEYIDDDLLNYNKGIFSIKWRKKYLNDAIRNADCIFSPSILLANEMNKLNINHKSMELRSVVPVCKRFVEKKIESINIVYAAGSEHEIFFEKNILPILGELDDKYGNRIQFTFIGVAPRIEKTKYRMTFNYIGYMDYPKYRNHMLISEYDIGLSPLENSSFNKYKYYNKYLEYSSFGIPAIYSDVEPYNSVIKNRENGILVDNNAVEWMLAICQMIDDMTLRKNIIDNAQRDLKENYSALTIRNEVISKLPEILVKHNSIGKRKVFLFDKLVYKVQRMFEFVWQVFYYINSDEYSFLEILRKKVKRNCFHIY